MKIAIIGAGNVGRALGQGLSQADHQVVYGVRDPAKESSGEKGDSTHIFLDKRAAAEQAEVVLLTLPWGAVEAVLTELGDLGGKPLIDATNPIGPGFTLTHGHTDSGAEQVQRWAPSARVVKAFNSNGVEIMRAPRRQAGPGYMPLCSDDEAALETVAGLARDLGYDTVTYPRLSEARLLEPLTLLWIKTAGRLGSREIAFHLSRQ